MVSKVSLVDHSIQKEVDSLSDKAVRLFQVPGMKMVVYRLILRNAPNVGQLNLVDYEFNLVAAVGASQFIESSERTMLCFHPEKSIFGYLKRYKTHEVGVVRFDEFCSTCENDPGLMNCDRWKRMDDGLCSGCKTTKFELEGKCLESCPAGYSKDEKNEVCSKCPDCCSECQLVGGLFGCQKVDEGFLFNQTEQTCSKKKEKTSNLTTLQNLLEPRISNATTEFGFVLAFSDQPEELAIHSTVQISISSLIEGTDYSVHLIQMQNANKITNENEFIIAINIKEGVFFENETLNITTQNVLSKDGRIFPNFHYSKIISKVPTNFVQEILSANNATTQSIAVVSSITSSYGSHLSLITPSISQAVLGLSIARLIALSPRPFPKRFLSVLKLVTQFNETDLIYQKLPKSVNSIEGFESGKEREYKPVNTIFKFEAAYFKSNMTKTILRLFSVLVFIILRVCFGKRSYKEFLKRSNCLKRFLVNQAYKFICPQHSSISQIH